LHAKNILHAKYFCTQKYFVHKAIFAHMREIRKNFEKFFRNFFRILRCKAQNFEKIFRNFSKNFSKNKFFRKIYLRPNRLLADLGVAAAPLWHYGAQFVHKAQNVPCAQNKFVL